MSIAGAFERLKQDNQQAAHRIYGRVMTFVEFCNRRSGTSDIVAEQEFVPDYNDEFFPEETDRELFESLQAG